MKSILMYSCLGIALGVIATTRSAYTILCECIHAGTYYYFTWDMLALILTAIIFLVIGFVKLLYLTKIPNESYQGENILIDNEPLISDASAF